MRSYLIDELSDADMEKIKAYMKKIAMPSRMADSYWIPLPGYLLTHTQCRHHACQPHVFAAELNPNRFTLELLIRSLKKMRCSCQGYATPIQQAFAIGFVDRMIQKLGILT